MTNSRPCGGAILVVDDDESLRACIAAVLRAAGFGVEVAGDGHEALAAAREHLVQAVVLDICLPGLSGYEVCRAHKEQRPELPVLFVSGERVESFDRVAGLLIGGDDYLVKPFAPDELLARLRALLHIEHIFQKLDVRSRAQAVAAAYRQRLVEDVEPV